MAVPVVWVGMPAWAGCSQADRNSGECRSIDGETGDNQVTIRVDTSTPGSSGSGGAAGSSGDTAPEPAVPGPPPPRPSGPPPPPRLPVLGSGECEIVLAGMCRGQSPPRNPPASTPPNVVAPTPPTPPRFASDLGSFRPDGPGLTIQPGEWSMPRLPTNFIAQAKTHTRSGDLAGWPVEVRFTPHRYHWNFGDGQRATWSVPGRSWSGWQVAQFQPTPTSHIYRTPGTYTASLRVEYRVEFRFVGETFERLSGTVSANSGTARIRVLTVSPLLLGEG